MIKITVDDKDYKLPQRLTVDQWMLAAKYQPTKANYSKIIASVLGLDWRDLKDQTEDLLEVLMGIVQPLIWGRRECKVRDWSNLTFGEWVDLDCWITRGSQMHLKDMTPILQSSQWADETLYRLESFNSYRTWVYRQYAELFGLNIDPEDDSIIQDEVEDSDPMDIVNGWYQIICGLASENLLWIDRVTEQPLLATLNFMAYQKQKQVAENFNKLKQKREYELQRRSR